MAYEHEEKLLNIPHKLTLDERSHLSTTGVTKVESFDEELVVIHTVKGTLVIRGQELHLQQLSLDGGQVHVDGKTVSKNYKLSPGETIVLVIPEPKEVEILIFWLPIRDRSMRENRSLNPSGVLITAAITVP